MTDLEEKDILKDDVMPEIQDEPATDSAVNTEPEPDSKLEESMEELPPEVEEQIMNATSALVLEADANRAQDQEVGEEPDDEESPVDIMKSVIERKDYKEFRRMATEMNEADVASVLEDLEEADLLKFFRVLPKNIAADVFAYLPIDLQ